MSCKEEELKSLIPKNARLTSGRNPLTNQVFGERQQNQFLKYGVAPYIRCNPGFLYPDRSSEKSVICTLVKDSLTEAKYQGYGGTILPLAAECVGN